MCKWETVDVSFKSSEAVEMGEWNRFLPWIGAFFGALCWLFYLPLGKFFAKTRQDAYRIVEKMTKQLGAP